MTTLIYNFSLFNMENWEVRQTHTGIMPNYIRKDLTNHRT